MEAWRSIPDYPEWFVFYGEEEFAAYHLFLQNWNILYVPQILVHHRVDISLRKRENDYQLRLRRSLRSGWFLMFLFFPWKKIPKRFAYSIWTQIKKRMFKGDIKGSLAIIHALGELIVNYPRIPGQSKRLTLVQFEQYTKLTDTKIYWNPLL
jgi:GT2 family glycosyltransferase